MNAHLHAASKAQPIQPEWVGIPAVGGDPITGFSRSWWFQQERAGRISLVRVRVPGKTRGRTLLPVADAISLVKSLASQAKKPAPADSPSSHEPIAVGQ